jgi:hypothetical protein
MNPFPEGDTFDDTTRIHVQGWMARALLLFPDMYPTSTILADACWDALWLAPLSQQGLVPEAVYALAREFFPDEP